MNRRKDLLLRLKKLLLQGIEMFQGNNMPVYSGYATLFIVTAVFPFIMLIISIVNLLPGYSVTSVAAVLGFSDAAHFSKRFKQFFGVSPKTYQK